MSLLAAALAAALLASAAPEPLELSPPEPAPAPAEPDPTSPDAKSHAPEPSPAPVAAPAPPSATSTIPISAKFGDGIRFDGDSLRFQLRGRIQLRGTMLVPDGAGTRINELSVRRLRLQFRALFYDTFGVHIQLAFANQDMEPDLLSPLRDAYFTWTPLRDLNFRVGQMKVPFGRQRLVSSSSLQMADRSIVTTELNLDRDIGFTVRSEDFLGLGGRLSYQLSVFSGDGRNRLATNAGLMYSARVQVAPFGAYEDLTESDVHRTPQPRMAISLSYARNNDTVRQRSTLSTTFKNGFVTYDHGAFDVAFKYRGFSFATEALIRKANRDVLPGATPEYSRSGIGYFVQAGYFVWRDLEASARFSDLRPFEGTDPAFQRQTELGGALSYYFIAHDLKLQADYFWLSGNAFRTGTHQLRLQLQAYF